MFLFLLYDILLCGIARFSRGNKKELRTFQPQKSKKKNKNSQPQTKFTGSFKKECNSKRDLSSCPKWTSKLKIDFY